MRHVQREELLDYVTYEEQRSSIRASAMATRSSRMLKVGDVLSFHFENRETVRYQVLEMIRAERIVREADILHELEVYNELLGAHGELGCTLFIAVEDEAARAIRLKEWLLLPSHLYALLPDGRRVRPTFDPRQVGDDRLSSVQFLKFNTSGQVPVGFGSDLSTLVAYAEVPESMREALELDLKDGA